MEKLNWINRAIEEVKYLDVPIKLERNLSSQALFFISKEYFDDQNNNLCCNLHPAKGGNANCNWCEFMGLLEAC